MASSDQTDPFEQLRLMHTSRDYDRDDLKQVMANQAGMAATTVLIQNAARLSARLTDMDPNTPVDLNADLSGFVQPPAAGGGANPTPPAAGASP